MKSREKAFKNSSYQSGSLFALFRLVFSQDYSYSVSDHKQELEFFFMVN